MAAFSGVKVSAVGFDELSWLPGVGVHNRVALPGV